MATSRRKLLSWIIPSTIITTAFSDRTWAASPSQSKEITSKDTDTAKSKNSDSNAIISSTSDTGGTEIAYKNPLSNDFQPAGSSTQDLYAIISSQNSRAFGPARAVVVGSIYSYASGNVSGNYSTRQCRATVAQSVNIGSEDCRADGGFRVGNFSSITSHATGETAVNLGSRRSWATAKHNVNIASVDANCGGGHGAVLSVMIDNGGISHVKIVSAGIGYSKNSYIAFYDRINEPQSIAQANCQIDESGKLISLSIIKSGSGYSDHVDANVLESGNYSVNIATANNSSTYGELSFNIGTNKCITFANRSGNIASNNCTTNAQYSFNLGAINSTSSGVNSGIISSQSSTASSPQSVVIASRNALSSGATSVAIASTNSSVTANGSIVFGRRTLNNIDNSLSGGDAYSGTASTGNTKFQIKMSTGDVNLSGSLRQNQQFTDVAKMFENIHANEIPVGSLVAWEGRKIRMAKIGDIEFSAHSRTFALLLGDTAFTWSNRYLVDEFGEILQEKVWDSETGEWESTLNEGHGGYKGGYVSAPVENPHYDPKLEQTPRSVRRSEWTPVCLLGEVHVRVDSSVTVDDYVMPVAEGIGGKSMNKTRMRCMEIRRAFTSEKGYAVALCLFM